MTVLLLAIKFNYERTTVMTDAINIRRNASQLVTVPEWQLDSSFNPEDSLAVYAIQETRGNTITIQANFMLRNRQKTAGEIRAVYPPGLKRNILGEVKAKKVSFQANGETGFETFELQNHRLWSRGVGVHYVTWIWQFRSGPRERWKDIATTKHKIYTVLGVPKSPWQQFPYGTTNTQLPWTDVMDYACQWAQGASTLDNAATRLTRAVYDLGQTLLEYDCFLDEGGLGSPHYTFLVMPLFSCTEFLERLGGGIGNGPYVNCSDCATIVSTFANILGCDLWQSRMGPETTEGFALNPILAIGTKVWEKACNNFGFFGQHEVAWKGDCSEDDEVFDACLQVDGDSDPTRPPHRPLLATNMRFGNPSEGQYRDRLAAPGPAGILNCNPLPNMRQRRLVF